MIRRRREALLCAALVAVAALLLVAGAAASSTVVVTPSAIGVTWFSGPPADTRPGGTATIAAGLGTPPLGIGSAQFTTNGPAAKAQLFNYSYFGKKLTDMDALSYYDYRSSSSTNSSVQRVALNIEADWKGTRAAPPVPCASFTTFIFEPTYQPGNVLLTDTWQQWNALNGGAGVWWSSKDIPVGATGPPWVACNPNGGNAGTPACAGKLFQPISTLLAGVPNAKVFGGFGLNVGSGWAGTSLEASDALAIGFSGDTTTYNFEPAPADTTAPTCVLAGFSGGSNETIHVMVGDSGSGLASIVPVTSNATTVIPPFVPGSTAPLDVTATKINTGIGATLKLTVTDVAGNQTVCDPDVPAVVNRTLHRGVQRVSGLGAIQSRLSIRNGKSGLSKVVVSVNGHRFTVRLKSGASSQLNVFSAMRPGHNRITIRSYGRSHAAARLTIGM